MEGVPEAGGEYNAQGVTNRRGGVNPSAPCARYRAHVQFSGAPRMLDPSVPAIAANRFGLGARPASWPPSAPTGASWLHAQLKGAPPRSRCPAAPLSEILRPGTEAATRAGGGASKCRRRSRTWRDSANTSADLYDRGDRALRSRPRAPSGRSSSGWCSSGQPLCGLGRQAVPGRTRRRLRARGDPAARARQLRRHAARGRTASGDAALPGQPPLGRPAFPGGAARRAPPGPRKIGLNENLAREIMELHTLGVDGGYTQADVTSFAEVLTGWSIGGSGRVAGRHARASSCFAPELHEPGAKTVLGTRYADSGGRRRARRCCTTWRASRRPPASSPPSWRATSSPTIRRRGGRRGSPAPSPHSERRPADGLPRADRMRTRPGSSRWRSSRRRGLRASRPTGGWRCRSRRGKRTAGAV